MKINTIEDVSNYITENWRYIKEEELLDLIDQSFNFGYNECENIANFNKDIISNQNHGNNYDEGYNTGHEEGYEEGHREGYEEGHREGYEEGCE